MKSGIFKRGLTQFIDSKVNIAASSSPARPETKAFGAMPHPAGIMQAKNVDNFSSPRG